MEIMSEGSVGRLLIPANYVGCLSANQMTGTFLLPAPHSAPVHCTGEHLRRSQNNLNKALWGLNSALLDIGILPCRARGKKT